MILKRLARERHSHENIRLVIRLGLVSAESTQGVIQGMAQYLQRLVMICQQQLDHTMVPEVFSSFVALLNNAVTEDG